MGLITKILPDDPPLKKRCLVNLYCTRRFDRGHNGDVVELRSFGKEVTRALHSLPVKLSVLLAYFRVVPVNLVVLTNSGVKMGSGVKGQTQVSTSTTTIVLCQE